MTGYYPFTIRENENRFIISAEIESPEIFMQYLELFSKYGYEPNGYCWESHITQIVEKIEPQLLKHIEFDSEAGGLYAYSDTRENQLKFVAILSPIFQDLAKLEEYVRQADRSRIDD